MPVTRSAPCRSDRLRSGITNIGSMLHLRAQAGTGGARAVGVVEGEHARRQLLHAHAAVGTGVVLRKHHLLSVDHVNDHQPAGDLHRRFQRIGQALVHALTHDQAVHHRLDGVLFVLFQLDLFRKLVLDAVHPHANVAVPPQIVQHLDVLALAPPDHRRQHLDARALRQRQDLIHHLVHRLLLDLLAADRAVRHADARIEQAQIVVDLRHCSHGRARVLARGLLVDGNRRGKPFDIVHIRLFHLPQELPRIGGERFHIPPLPLRIERIERQRRLARSGQPRQHHQFVSRQLHVHVFQVVFARALDEDAVVHACF